MVPSTKLQCHPCARATLIFMLMCSPRAKRASLKPRSLSEGMSNQLRHIVLTRVDLQGDANDVAAPGRRAIESKHSNQSEHDSPSR